MRPGGRGFTPALAMYGQEKTIRGANRRYQADAGGSQGSQGREADKGSQEPKKDKGPQEQQLVRDAKTEASKASEEHTRRQSELAKELSQKAKLKTPDCLHTGLGKP